MGESIRSYARHCGVSDTAIRKRIERGAIPVLPDGSIDRVAADRAWARNAHPGRAKHPARARVTAGYAAARAVRETYAAKMAELEFRHRCGDLIDAGAVRHLAFASARHARDLLLSAPSRLAPVVSGLSDVAACERVIEAEMQRVAEELEPRLPAIIGAIR